VAKNGAKHRRIIAKPKAIQTARIEQGFTVSEFARRVGVSPAQIYLIEARKAGASDKSAGEICRVLGMSFDELFDIFEPVPTMKPGQMQLALGVAEREVAYDDGTGLRRIDAETVTLENGQVINKN